jgi:zinc protease
MVKEFTERMKIPKVDIFRKVLNNGITLLLNENHKLPICTVMIWLRVGARNESPGITGMSHYLEHCYSMGTKRFKPRENSWLIQRMGGTKNAFTSQDYTAYYSNIPSEHLETIMDMEADRLMNLALPEENVLAEKEVIKEEKRLRYEDSPFGKMYEVMSGLAYEKHPYKNTVIGSWDDLERMTREDMLEYYKKWYVPQNVVIVIAGDITRDRALQLSEKYFCSMSNGSISELKIQPDSLQQSERRKTIRKEAELPSVMMAFQSVSMDHADFIPLSFLSHILAAGRSSRLYRSLVYEKQIATFVSASMEATKDPGLFQIMAQAQIGHSIGEVEKAVKEEILKIQQAPVSEAELGRVRNMVESGFIHALETNEYRAEMIGRYEIISEKCGCEYVNLYPDLIEKVTQADILRVAKQYLISERRNVVILDPIKRN